MSTIQIELAYGGADGKHYTMRKLLSCGNNQDYTGGESDVDLSLIVDPATIDNTPYAVNLVSAYLKCLETLCEPMTQIKSCFITQFNNTAGDWDDRTIAYYQATDFSGFAPASGNTPKSGPRGSNFIGARQATNGSHKYGWLRWHYIAGNILQLPEIIPLSAMPAQFQSFYPVLRHLGGGLGPYATLSTFTTQYRSTVDQSIPEASFHQGIRNG